MRCRSVFPVLLAVFAVQGLPAQTPTSKPLRIIAFGAHPDDAELKFAGTAALFAAQGAQGQARRAHQRRRRPLRAGGRSARPAPQGRSRGVPRQAGRRDGRARHSRRRADAGPRDAEEGRESDPGMAGRHRALAPSRGIIIRITARSANSPRTPPSWSRPRTSPRTRRRRRAIPSSSSTPTVSRSRIRSIPSSPSASTRSRRRSGTASARCPPSSRTPTRGRRDIVQNVPTDEAGRKAFLLEGVKQRSADVANQYRDLLVKLYGESEGSRRSSTRRRSS